MKAKEWSHIGVHCAATHNGVQKYDRDWCRRLHKNHKKWSDIGYHYYIEANGTLKTGRGLHRNGAHIKQKDMNEKAIGICVAGTDQFSAKQFLVLRNLILKLQKKFGISNTRIKGHREYSNKICPGYDPAYLRKYIKTGELGNLENHLYTGKIFKDMSEKRKFERDKKRKTKLQAAKKQVTAPKVRTIKVKKGEIIKIVGV